MFLADIYIRIFKASDVHAVFESLDRETENIIKFPFNQKCKIVIRYI